MPGSWSPLLDPVADDQAGLALPADEAGAELGPYHRDDIAILVGRFTPWPARHGLGTSTYKPNDRKTDIAGEGPHDSVQECC